MKSENVLTASVAPLAAAMLMGALALLAGCPSDSGNSGASPPPVAQAAGFHGTLFGGRQPIVGARIVVYASGATAGAAAVKIGSDTTDASGRFDIPSFSPAPTAGQIVYVIARGGTAVSGGSANAAIRLMTVAGVKGSSLAPVVGTVNINELTTVASTAALQHYIAFGTCPAGVSGSDCVLIPGGPGRAEAAAQVNNLVDVTSGKAATFLTGPPSGTPPFPSTLAKLDTLASILAGCVNATGPSATACTSFFALATSGTTSLTPTDTLEAAFNVAADAVANARVKSLFTLLPLNPVFTPVMESSEAAAGAYWTVGGQTWVYEADRSGAFIAGFRLTDVGNLVNMGFGSGPEVEGVDALTVGPRGRFLYAGGRNIGAGTGSVSDFAINPATGSLNFSPVSTFPSGNVSSVAVDAKGRFVYAANHESGGGVSGWTFDSVTGEMTPITGSPFLTGLDTPTSVVSDTAGKILVVTEYESGRIKTYSMDQTTGALGALVTDAPAIGPWGAVVAPGNFLFTSFLDGNEVASWRFLTSGSLTPVTGASTGTCGTTPEYDNCIPTGTGPRDVTVGRIHGSDSSYLFVANSGNDNVSLLALSGSGQPSGLGTAAAGAAPWDIASDPGGNYAWAANEGDNTLTAYTLDSTTGITQRTDFPKTTPAGPEPFYVVLSSDGGHAWTASNASNLSAVSGYNVAGNGALTPITAGTVTPVACGNIVRDPNNCMAAVNTPFSFQVTPDDTYLYAAYFVLNTTTFQYDSEIAAWKINGDGTLSAITDGTTAPGSCAGVTPDNGNCFPAGADPLLQVSPDGKFLYAVNFEGDDISAWKINSDGTLAANAAAQCNNTSFGIPIANLPSNCYPAGPGGLSLNMKNDPYLYAVNYGSLTAPTAGQPKTVSAWKRNVTTGALTAIAGASCGNAAGETDPANCVYAGDGATSITVAPSKTHAYVANVNGNNVSAYTINATSGALAPITTGGAGNCFTPTVAHDPANCFDAGIAPGGITAVHESSGGTFAYAVNLGGSDISAWKIGSDGVLVAVAGHPCGTAATSDPDNCFATGHGAGGVAVSSTDNGDGYAYVVETAEGVVAEYSVNATGKLTLIGTVFAGSSPRGMTFNAAGDRVYLPNDTENDIVVFTRSGGLLTPLATDKIIPAGYQPAALAVTQ